MILIIEKGVRGPQNMTLNNFGQRFSRHLLFILIWSFILAPGLSRGQGEAGSGIYENGNLILGVNRAAGVVTGYFESCVGYDEMTKRPRFCCIFFLYGKKAGDKYQITTWYPGTKDVIEGELRLPTPGKANLFIRLKESPPGSMAYPFDVDKGNDFPLESAGDWIEVRVVSAAKAFFHREPDAKGKRSAYVVKRDVVRVYEKKNGWVLAEYRKTRGWLAEKDLFSLQP
jgi:hypothetical protein